MSEAPNPMGLLEPEEVELLDQELLGYAATLREISDRLMDAGERAEQAEAHQLALMATTSSTLAALAFAALQPRDRVMAETCVAASTLGALLEPMTPEQAEQLSEALEEDPECIANLVLEHLTNPQEGDR